jgi:hypothetical protein
MLGVATCLNHGTLVPESRARHGESRVNRVVITGKRRYTRHFGYLGTGFVLLTAVMVNRAINR